MSLARSCTAIVMAACVGAGFATPLLAQGWSADVSTGRIAYDPISAEDATSNVAGTLRYDTPGGRTIYGSGAAPMRARDPLWLALGGGGRFMPRGSATRRVAVGADAAGEAFLFRDRVALQTGNGGSFDALPFVRVASGPASVEFRGGWRAQALSLGGVVERRAVFETGGRAFYETSALQAEGDLRWVRASEGTYPYLGGSVVYGVGRGYVSAHVGRWLSDTLDDVAWGGGGGVAVGPRSTVWATLRQQPSDPLYWNAPRRTWSVGVTQRLGRVRSVLQPATPAKGGEVVIRLPAADAPASELWVAGDFNGWKPVPMRLQGREWVLSLRLGPGVYKYAFRKGDREWFVPASVASRRDDGMGGHVAVLVVI
jgi:hypothetical protein